MNNLQKAEYIYKLHLRRAVCLCTICVLSLLCFAPSTDARNRKTDKGAKKTVVLTPKQVADNARFDYLYFEYLQRFNAGKYDEAFELITQAVEVNPHSAPALFALAEGFELQSKFQQAMSCMRRALDIDGTNYWYLIKEARLFRQLKLAEPAIDTYERLAELYPNKSDLFYELADFYVRIDSSDLAIKALNKLESLDGMNPQVTMQKFYIYQQKGMVDEAFAQYDSLIASNPYEVAYYITKGDLQMKFGQMREAKTTYDEAAKIAPDNAYLWVAQANYLNLMGETEAADTLVQAALVNQNLDIETKIDILTDYLKSTLRMVAAEKQKAADTTSIVLPGVDSLFDMVIEMHPSSADVYELYAEYLNAIHNDTLAVRCMKTAVDLKPDDDTFWNRYLSLLFEGNLDTLKHEALRSLKHRPNLFMAYTALAYVNVEKKNYDAALSNYQELLMHLEVHEMAKMSTVWGNIGDIYHQMGESDKAYEAYDQSLRYNDKNISVLNNYSYFLSLEKRDLSKAEQMCSVVIRQNPDDPTYLDTYAWIYFQQGIYSLAKLYEEKAVQNAGAKVSAALLEHYGDILFMCGDKTGAMDNWINAKNSPNASESTSRMLDEKIEKGEYIEDVPDWLKKKK